MSLFMVMLNNQHLELPSSKYNYFYQIIYQPLQSLELPNKQAHTFTAIILLIVFALLMLVVNTVVKTIISNIVRRLFAKGNYTIVNTLFNDRVISKVSHLIPLLITRAMIPVFFTGFAKLVYFSNLVIGILIIFGVTLILSALVHSITDYLKTKPAFEDKPLDSYRQVITISLYCIALIVSFSIVSGRDITVLLASLGAVSAILMLVFKDPIMGLVASVQVSSNDMVRIGDWIQMSKYGADGTVLEINLNTVKVQNFDKTISTIPTHLLISESFVNYRGMVDSGGRRIKRYINIKMSKIKFLDAKDIQKLKEIEILKPYIDNKQKQISEDNTVQNINTNCPLNGRRLTNIGLFRAYVLLYTQNNPDIHKDYYLMVRQLQSNEFGMPLELYMFTNGTAWDFHEAVMGDIFDHLLASIHYFDLEVFESVSSSDLKFLK